jgi:saccharopine dehydrogenase-like NADP-dependent oxidoreductase
VTDGVLVVGGYGTIGRTVCTELATGASRRVVAAGRTDTKAAAFADSVEGVQSAVVDAEDPATYDEALEDADVAVVCLDQDEPTFAKACLERGVDYVDISPSDTLLREIEAFDGVARARDATAVLSVGLSPGMTNLFVADATETLDSVERAEISLLLGLGERFGPDTVKWTLEDAVGTFSVRRDGVETLVRAFTDPRRTELHGWGTRRVYRANLADQHVLARTTSIPSISTRICYDSRPVTRCLALLHRTGLYQHVVDSLGVDRTTRLLDRLPFGSDESIVQTEVEGIVDDRLTRITRWVRGTDQARATALVTATVVRHLLSSRTPTGVHHVHQLFETESFSQRLTASGYEVGRTTQGIAER